MKISLCLTNVRYYVIMIIKSFSNFGTNCYPLQVTMYCSDAQNFWLVGHICFSENLRGPQELIIFCMKKNFAVS